MNRPTRMIKAILYFWIFTVILWSFASCNPRPDIQEQITQTPSIELKTISTHTPVAFPTHTETIAAPPAATRLPIPQICSPLEGYSLAQIPDTITNPFNPPAVGSDDPHQAVDLSDIIKNSQVAIDGRIVQAVLSGRVAGVIRDRFPYGNALLVETPLDEMPASWLAHLDLPASVAQTAPHSVLTCPQTEENNSWLQDEKRSLYLLYAHLQMEPGLQPDERVECGQAIGAVGMSGNALNPHLHLEVRVGPAGASFSSMAHYDSSATTLEMGNYCLWRVSNLFQPVDPLKLFSLP
ncbi:MAG: peptidoglycan DD-metalloendopeptidase family protein [Anaerolineaceae bacterium]|nr:peptidoglycan DD-metalloendopeptidase family protein [Anaerolineaceae bacterium]